MAWLASAALALLTTAVSAKTPMLKARRAVARSPRSTSIAAEATTETILSGLQRFYIGTQTAAGGSTGIYQSSLNSDAGTFGAASLAVTSTSPTFLALTADRRFLYAVNDTANTVSAFAVNASTGVLTFLNSQSSNGAFPTHLTVDKTGRQVIVSNYLGGSITMYPVQADGQLGAANAHYQYAAGSRAHCAKIDANNHFVFVCDLGLDQIRSYVLNAALGTLTPNTPASVSVAASSGPRHLAFDPQEKRAYVICETNSTVIGFNYDATLGTLSAFQTKSTLPAGFSGSNICAEIVVHPSGHFVYGSNRGYNSIVVFSVDAADGTLTVIQQQPTGMTPRNFALDPTGRYCLVASQDSDDVTLLNIDQQTGLLTAAGQSFSVAKPVCLLPYLLQPPAPDLAIEPATTGAFRLKIGHASDLLYYRLYQAPALTGATAWNFLLSGGAGQSSFQLNYSSSQQFFRAELFENY